jgi:hypothetical protein
MTPDQYKEISDRLARIEKKVDGWLYTAVSAIVTSLAALATSLLR